MHLTTTALLASIPLLVAAADQTQTASNAGSTPSSSSPKCDAQDILDACLKSLKPQLEKCPANDWKCLCEQSGNVLTCYNNCPSASDKFSLEQQSKSYCNAADTLPSSSVSTSSITTSTSSAAKKTSSSATATSSSSQGAAAAATGFGTVEGGLMVGVLLGVLGV